MTIVATGYLFGSDVLMFLGVASGSMAGLHFMIFQYCVSFITCVRFPFQYMALCLA
jgi:hypothetical protein